MWREPLASGPISALAHIPLSAHALITFQMPESREVSLPHGITDDEFIEAIDRVAHSLASYAFGPYTAEDIKSLCCVYSMEALAKPDGYDVAKPLANFLYQCCRFRILNLRRKEYKRIEDPPCEGCHLAANDSGLMYCGPNNEPCRQHKNYVSRNQAKANLQRPMPFDRMSPKQHEEWLMTLPIAEVEAETKEILERIDALIGPELRQDMLLIRAGIRVPKPRRLRVENAVKEILDYAGVDVDWSPEPLPQPASKTKRHSVGTHTTTPPAEEPVAA